MRFNLLKFLTIAVAALSAVHGQSQEPIVGQEMPARWLYSESMEQPLPSDDAWWKGFDDPVLDSLISLGINRNYDVLMAKRRIEIARQGLRQARAGYFPQFSFDAGWNKSRTLGMTGPVAGKAATVSYFDLGIDMSWEIDVFGKITAKAKESKAQYNASRAEYDAMMVTICSKIASAYMQLRMLQAQIAVTEQHIASQERVTKITEARFEAGLASMLDVTQSRTTLYSTQATITALQSSETATINSLAVLLGTYPADIDPALRQKAKMPEYNRIVSAGVPMELLRRRPDIEEAEYTLASYAAALGVSKKEFLPTLVLNGSIGTSAHKIGDLMDKQSLSYTIAPTLSWTIFDGLAREAGIEAAKQQMLAGIDNYNMTVLTAVQEVETALASYHNDLDYISMLDKVVEEAKKSFDLSIDLYKQGLSTFLNVSTSQIALLQYSNELVAARGQALADLITLYEALGGGWQYQSTF